MKHCRWIVDAGDPDGRYLIPGCWNRAVYGDYADCHCADRPEALREQVDRLDVEIAKLRGKAMTDEERGKG